MIKLKELRKRKKIKAKELAKAINVSESAISLYENGKREPDSQTLLKIANFINVSIDELLCSKRGAVSYEDYCGKYKYDATKRVPQNPIISKNFSKEDFSL